MPTLFLALTHASKNTFPDQKNLGDFYLLDSFISLFKMFVVSNAVELSQKVLGLQVGGEHFSCPVQHGWVSRSHPHAPGATGTSEQDLHNSPGSGGLSQHPNPTLGLLKEFIFISMCPFSLLALPPCASREMQWPRRTPASPGCFLDGFAAPTRQSWQA